MLYISFTDKLPNNVTLNDDDVWFGESMQTIDWPGVFKELAPFISYTDRNMLLDISGTDGVSPALLLSAAIYYKNEKKNSFKRHIERISVKLMESFFNSTSRTNDQKTKENDATHAIWLFVEKDSKQMNEFISILKAVKTEATRYQDLSNNILADARQIIRGTGDETSLRFPFSMSE